MSDMKCPFCQQEMVIPKEEVRKGIQCCVCRNPKCEFDGWHFPVKIITALIDTKEECDKFEQHYKCLSHVFKHQIEVNDFLNVEANKLQKKLGIAVGALKRIRFRGQHSKNECCKVSGNIADKALEQIKDNDKDVK